MEKLKITVGFVFTQVMFCDEHGKLQFHRVMTDVDKPWNSVIELLNLVRNALSLDKPKVLQRFMPALHIELQFKKVNFTSLLESLREQLSYYLSNSCPAVTIHTMDHEESSAPIEHQEAEQAEEAEETMAAMGEQLQDLPERDGIQSFLMEKDLNLLFKHEDDKSHIEVNSIPACPSTPMAAGKDAMWENAGFVLAEGTEVKEMRHQRGSPTISIRRAEVCLSKTKIKERRDGRHSNMSFFLLTDV